LLHSPDLGLAYLRFGSGAVNRFYRQGGRSEKDCPPQVAPSSSARPAEIDAQRAREIQEALIREHYLSGKPSGKWDTATQNALVRFQGDNGWQTKVVPDSRALIKLGLGPDQDHLLNPESAMTTVPQAAQHADSASSADSPKKP
jgi:hypothetical protein